MVEDIGACVARVGSKKRLPITRASLATRPEQHRVFYEEAVPHVNLLRNAAMQMTGNRADAEDLLQETLFKAYCAFNSYQQGTNCKAWLFTFLRNNFCNAYRKRKVRPMLVSLEDVEGFLHSNERPPIPIPESVLDNPAIEELMEDDVREAISKLTDEYRRTLLLCDVHGFMYREAAEVMSCPIGTVRSRLSRARRAMRRSLKDTEVERRMLNGTKETVE